MESQLNVKDLTNLLFHILKRIHGCGSRHHFQSNDALKLSAAVLCLCLHRLGKRALVSKTSSHKLFTNSKRVEYNKQAVFHQLLKRINRNVGQSMMLRKLSCREEMNNPSQMASLVTTLRLGHFPPLPFSTRPTAYRQAENPTLLNMKEDTEHTVSDVSTDFSEHPNQQVSLYSEEEEAHSSNSRHLKLEHIKKVNHTEQTHLSSPLQPSKQVEINEKVMHILSQTLSSKHDTHIHTPSQPLPPKQLEMLSDLQMNAPSQQKLERQNDSQIFVTPPIKGEKFSDSQIYPHVPPTQCEVLNKTQMHAPSTHCEMLTKSKTQMYVPPQPKQLKMSTPPPAHQHLPFEDPQKVLFQISPFVFNPAPVLHTALTDNDLSDSQDCHLGCEPPPHESGPERMEEDLGESGVDLSVVRNDADGRQGRPRSEFIPRYKRAAHKEAEFRRRGKIQKAFDDVKYLLPSTRGQYSQTTLLKRCRDHIVEHTADCARLEKEKERARKEMLELHNDIQACQRELSSLEERTSNVPADRMFEQYVRDSTCSNWKFWLFSYISRELWNSFSSQVSTVNTKHFLHTVSQWADKCLTLRCLRPVTLASLRNLSVKTSILTEPSKLQEEIQVMMNSDVNNNSFEHYRDARGNH